MIAANLSSSQASFDDAIKRAGRFDFLLCMGPPTLRAKCDSIHVFFDGKSTADSEAAGEMILTHAAKDDWLWDQLSLYTYDEFSTLISGLGKASELKALGKGEFRQKVKKDVPSVYLKRDDLENLRKLSNLKRWKRITELDAADFNEKDLELHQIDPKNPAIKYVLDRKQTRRQYPKSAM